MPIVAIAGMIGGATALAAGGLTVLQTISAIGSILGGIGAITGNKKLAAVGAIAGLAGGIGAFAQGKGWLADPSATGTASGAADASFIEAAKAAPSGVEGGLAQQTAAMADVGMPAGELGTVDFGQAATQTTGGLAGTRSITDTLSQASPEVARTGGGLMDAGTNPLAQSGPMPGAETLGGPASSSLVPDATPTSGSATSLPKGDYGPGVGTLGGANTFPGAADVGNTAKAGGGILDSFKGLFMDKDGKMNKEMMSMAGNFVGGMFDSEKEAREELYRVRADTERQQMANANAVPTMDFRSTPKPGGTFRQTQPTYRPVQINRGGLYNAR